jgi:hypothetical protein
MGASTTRRSSPSPERLDLCAQIGQNACVTKEEALKEVAEDEVVPCISLGIAEIKEVFDACLEAGIPAILDRQEACKDQGHSCAPKIDLCVRPDDLPKLMAILHARWQSLLDQEGTLVDRTAVPAECEDPPCPACGTVGPLLDGACKECGLQLEQADS